jgi:hypothetical protein
VRGAPALYSLRSNSFVRTNDAINGVTDAPPLKWSDLRYVFDIKEDCNGAEFNANEDSHATSRNMTTPQRDEDALG